MIDACSRYIVTQGAMSQNGKSMTMELQAALGLSRGVSALSDGEGTFSKASARRRTAVALDSQESNSHSLPRSNRGMAAMPMPRIPVRQTS